MKAKKLLQDYVVCHPSGKSEVWCSDDFWKMAFDKNHPQNKPDMGYLVSQFDFDEDWQSWEIHPNGDEFVFCISGKIRFILETSKGPDEVTLLPGTFIVVPNNTWHTAKVDEPSKALFVTWGYGTEHRNSGTDSHL